MAQTFIIIYKPGPAWVEGKSVGEQQLLPHGDYMHQLYQNGALRFAGPFIDDSGGATVIETTDMEAAQDILKKDPAIISGVFTAEIHPWYLVDWENFKGSQ